MLPWRPVTLEHPFSLLDDQRNETAAVHYRLTLHSRAAPQPLKSATLRLKDDRAGVGIDRESKTCQTDN